MLVISFDSVGDKELDELIKYPAISRFMKSASIYRDVSSIYVSNTYPAHTSVSTGVLPSEHGISSNMEPFPSKTPVWYENERDIRVKTIWQAAFEKGIETAAILWPVTGYSKFIKYNIPEVHVRPGKNQLISNLKSGSKLLQIKLALRYRKILDGIKQPNLDYFAASCLAEILDNNNPGLALIHLVAYDNFCHKYGRGSDELQTAFKSLDENLTTLLKAAGADRDVIVFSDHSQLSVHTSININKMLVKMGLLSWDGVKYLPGESGCFVETCGGCAFFHAGAMSNSAVKEMKNKISGVKGFLRFLTDEEMFNAGQTSAFGFCAAEGYCFETFPSGHKATHGFSVDMPHYKVFYMIRGKGFAPGTVKSGGSIVDITNIIIDRLKLKM